MATRSLQFAGRQTDKERGGGSLGKARLQQSRDAARIDPERSRMSASAPMPRAARIALLFCSVAALLEGFDNQSMGVAAPKLIPEFGLSSGQASIIFSAATLGLFVGAALGGRAADRFGRRRVLTLSMLLFGILAADFLFSGRRNAVHCAAAHRPRARRRDAQFHRTGIRGRSRIAPPEHGDRGHGRYATRWPVRRADRAGRIRGLGLAHDFLSGRRRTLPRGAAHALVLARARGCRARTGCRSGGPRASALAGHRHRAVRGRACAHDA